MWRFNQYQVYDGCVIPEFLCSDFRGVIQFPMLAEEDRREISPKTKPMASNMALCLLVAALILVGGVEVEEQCHLDIPALVSQCLMFVSPAGPKVPPSQACCDVVQKADMGCVCQIRGGSIPIPISMDKICYVANLCHNPLTPDSHCGSYTVPAMC